MKVTRSRRQGGQPHGWGRSEHNFQLSKHKLQQQLISNQELKQAIIPTIFKVWKRKCDFYLLIPLQLTNRSLEKKRGK